MESPNLFVIAGPNGIGKTTSAFDLIPANIPLINSDEIAATVRNAHLPDINVQEFANGEAIKMMNEYLSKGLSFAVETNLADKETWKFLIEVQRKGYHINLLYLSTDDLQLLNSRIEQRVLAGEHYVRPDIVEERYTNGLHLLNHYFKVPDLIYLVDNSSGGLALMAEIHKGHIAKLYHPLPLWIRNTLSEHFEQKQEREQKQKKVSEMDSIDEVKKAYEEKKKKNPRPRL